MELPEAVIVSETGRFPAAGLAAVRARSAEVAAVLVEVVHVPAALVVRPALVREVEAGAVCEAEVAGDAGKQGISMIEEKI